MAMHPRRPPSGRRPWTALVLTLALAACGEPPDDARVQRLQSDLDIAQERISVLERRLAEATSDNADREELRDTLAKAEARLAELQTPEGLAQAATERVGEGGVRERLVEASRSLRAADRRLSRVSGDRETANAAATPEDVARTARAARDDVAAAAENIVGAASSLGMEIIGLQR